MSSDSDESEEDMWSSVLKKVLPAVVVLRTTVPRTFDTEFTCTKSGTGFVVDKRRGIILTNRNVVNPGPVVAEAMFRPDTLVPVYPLYRDPVHDFGFLRYDPGAIKMDFEEIPLAPEAASFGLEIRVVGNVSTADTTVFFSGILDHLESGAPHDEKNGYNDFNTFYIQAACDTAGCSSGSPVINCHGQAIALSSDRKSSSALTFFFPLDRVVRALEYLQNGRDSCHDKWEAAITIPRGTIQATFVHKGFDEARRLGLQTKTEKLVRDASSLKTGMLVVDSVVPDGPAYKHLEPGDVLVRMNGKLITRFLEMSSMLDDAVGQNVKLEFERRDVPMTVQLKIQDLHSITPTNFLEVEGAILHPLSYQQARNFYFPCGLVYVSEPGSMLSRAGVPEHAIIKKLAGEDVSCLEDFINALSKLSRGDRVPLEYISYTDRWRPKSVLVTVARHEWYPSPQIYTRDDIAGIWKRKQALLSDSQLVLSIDNKQDLTRNPDVESCLVEQLANRVHSTDTSSFEHADEVHVQDETDIVTSKCRLGDAIATENHTTGNSSLVERVIEPALVKIKVYVPLSCMVDGVDSVGYFGTGVIIYHSGELGLVAVDRNTVAISASEVMISFAASPIEISGEVVFLHPVHNYAIIAYDPSALGPAMASLVQAAELLPEPGLHRGETVYLVDLDSNLRAISRKSSVTNPYASLDLSYNYVPSYRAANMEFIEVDADCSSNCAEEQVSSIFLAGVLTNEYGKVKALWGSFSIMNCTDDGHGDIQIAKGIPIHSLNKVLKEIISGGKGPSLAINGMRRRMPQLRILGVELKPVSLSQAQSIGLSDKWIRVLEDKDPCRCQVLQVQGCLAGSRAMDSSLREGDMILAVDKNPVTCYNDLDDACHALDDGHDHLQLTIWDSQEGEVKLRVETDTRDGSGTRRAINWCGGLAQYPHPAVSALGLFPEEGHGVYVSMWCRGSPMERFKLPPCRWIVEVNGKKTPDLDTFVDVIRTIEDGDHATVKIVNLEGESQELRVKQDLHYWPTWELSFDAETAMWRRRLINPSEDH